MKWKQLGKWHSEIKQLKSSLKLLSAMHWSSTHFPDICRRSFMWELWHPQMFRNLCCQPPGKISRKDQSEPMLEYSSKISASKLTLENCFPQRNYGRVLPAACFTYTQNVEEMFLFLWTRATQKISSFVRHKWTANSRTQYSRHFIEFMSEKKALLLKETGWNGIIHIKKLEY